MTDQTPIRGRHPGRQTCSGGGHDCRALSCSKPFLALVLVTGFACTTWATCEPPPSEKTYQPMQIKRPAVYRPLVSMTGSKPFP